MRNNLKGVKKGIKGKGDKAEKGAWDEEVFKTSFTSFWLKDVEFVILSSESKDQDLKTTSTKPDRTRPLWEEKWCFLSRVDDLSYLNLKGGDDPIFSSESRVGRLTNKPKGLVKLDFIKARNEGYLERG